VKHEIDEPFIDQSELSDPCPCGSKKLFGACCGKDNPCDCKSHWNAGECCYSPEELEATMEVLSELKKIEKKQL